LKKESIEEVWTKRNQGKLRHNGDNLWDATKLGWVSTTVVGQVLCADAIVKEHDAALARKKLTGFRYAGRPGEDAQKDREPKICNK
jgi:hypothetical protein